MREILRVFRCLSLPGNRILSAPRHRILSDPALHTEPARRHLVLGLVLDQCRRESGARFHRPADHIKSSQRGQWFTDRQAQSAWSVLGHRVQSTSRAWSVAGDHRPADGADVDDAVDRRQRVSAASQLRQSHRRLDVCLPCVW